ncbi:MAG: 3-deoxy-D-manno-octulosonic acid transferase [Chthoniobacterales bacterium]
MNRCIFLLYNLLFPFALLFLLPGFLKRMLKRGNYRHKFGQRFSIYSQRVTAGLLAIRSEAIWVHAVSVGEVLVALKFIQALRKENPDQAVVLSSTTSTGFTLAHKHLRTIPRTQVIYHPVDFYPSVNRIMNLLRPCALIMVEAEIWPNLTHAAKKHGALLALINSRLSPRSERRYLRIRPFLGGLFRQLDWIGVQAEADITRFTALGARAETLHSVGSIKYDQLGQPAPAKNPDLSKILTQVRGPASRPVLLAGSTHAGEEKIIAETFLQLRKQLPDLFLILVPRHAERRQDVLSDLQSLGLSATLRSAAQHEVNDILLVDSTGELSSWYCEADVVFIGKSLTGRGGQNPVEALAAGKPVVFGPHMKNFPQLTTELLAAKGAIQVADKDELHNTLLQLFRSPETCKNLSQAGQEVLTPHQGATQRTVQKILTKLTAPHRES